MYTYETSLKADKEDRGGDLEFAIELTIQLNIELAIDLSHSSYESTWNHMDQNGLTTNRNEYGLVRTNKD